MSLCIFYSSRSQIFFKIGVLKNFTTFTGKHLCCSLLLLKKPPTQVLSCEYCEFFIKKLFYRTPPLAAFVYWNCWLTAKSLFLNFFSRKSFRKDKYQRKFRRHLTGSAELRGVSASAVKCLCSHVLRAYVSFMKQFWESHFFGAIMKLCNTFLGYTIWRTVFQKGFINGSFVSFSPLTMTTFLKKTSKN